MELSARFADENEVEQYKNMGYKELATEKGKLLLPKTGVRTADTVTFDLSQFLWMSMIEFDGIYRAS